MRSTSFNLLNKVGYLFWFTLAMSSCIFLFYDWPFLHVRRPNLDENIIFQFHSSFLPQFSATMSSFTGIHSYVLTQRRHLATVASANISWYLTGHSHVEQTAVSIGILIKIGSYTPMILNCRYHVYGIIVSDISLKTRPRCFGLHYCPRMFTFIFNHFYAMCPGSYRVRWNNAI